MAAENELEIKISDATKPGAAPAGLSAPPPQAVPGPATGATALALERIRRETLAEQVKAEYSRLTAAYKTSAQRPAAELPEAQPYTPPTAGQQLRDAASAFQGNFLGSQTLSSFATKTLQAEKLMGFAGSLFQKIPKALPAQGVPTAAGATAEGAAGEAAVGGEVAGAAAAGPAGMVIAAAMVAKDKIERMAGDAVRAVGTTAERVGGITAAAARGNNAEALGQAGEGAIELVKAIPVVGEKLGLVAEQAGKVVKAFVGVVDAFTERGRELSGFSGPLAISHAMGDLQSLLDDLKEAEQLGPGLARLNDSQTRLTHELREILLPIKVIIVDKLAALFESLEGRMTRLEERIEKSANAVGVGMNILAPGIVAIAEAILGHPARTEEERQKAINAAKTEAFWQDVEDKLRKMGPLPGAGVPANLPIFPGQRVLPPLLQQMQGAQGR